MAHRLAADVLLHDQDTIETLRNAAGDLAALDCELRSVACRGQNLRRGIDDQCIVIGKECRRTHIVAAQIGLGQVERYGFRTRIEGRGPGRWLRQFRARRLENFVACICATAR
jgi:hypothetical protein